jgi:hypothetical protein
VVSTPAPMGEPIPAQSRASLTVRVDTLARDICRSKIHASETVIELLLEVLADRSGEQAYTDLSSHCD